MRHLLYPTDGWKMSVVDVKSVTLENDSSVRFGRKNKDSVIFKHVTQASLKRVAHLLNVGEKYHYALVTVYSYEEKSFGICRHFFIRDDEKITETAQELEVLE